MSDSISKQKVIDTLDFANNALTDEERTVEKYKELLTECIKVLPSTENKGDLISRQAVLDRTVNRNSIWNKITDSEGNNLEDILNSIPSAENKGEWEEWKGSRYYGLEFCSNCKRGFPYIAKEYNFCPNCGADMRGET